MEYNSFYGGRRGASFIIVKEYESIAAMIECFQQGGAYRTVNYDEYVLINTVNLNDKDNGKVFRRGYEYNNEMGGAEYIGQIVGPAGMAPHVEMKTIKEVKDLATEDNLKLVDSNGEHLYRLTEGEYAPTENLIPGKYLDEDGNEQFNDKIQYAACSIKDENSHISTAHIGFIIPYPVIEYIAKTVSPYYHRTDAENQEMDNWDETGDTINFDNDKLVTREDDATHPFFSRWKISVPKGKKGDSLKGFRVSTVAEERAKNPNWLQSYPGIDDDETTEAVKKERKILVYDYYNYDRDASGDPVTLYLGDYNIIDNFEIDEYGTVTIDYSHGDEDVYQNLFKWVKSISLNKETGKFEIEYNYDKTRDGEDNAKEDTKYEMFLTWVKDIDIFEDGTITFTYTDQDDKVYDNFIKWIKEVKLNGETGHFEVIYNYDNDPDTNNPTKYEVDLRWVDNIVLADDGTVTLEYTTGNDVILDNKIKWIDTVELAENGTVTVTYNNNTTDVFDKKIKWISNITLTDAGLLTIEYNDDTPDFTKTLKWPISISINTGTTEGTGNQKMVIHFNDNTTEEVGNPINYIMKTAISDDYHLLVLHSDPAKRQELIDNNKNYTFDGRNDWQDMGSVKDDDGILIGLNLDANEIPEVEEVDTAITYLNANFPNGLTGADLQGKIITCGIDEKNKMFFAFDYSKKADSKYKGWYYLGSIETASASFAGKENDPATIKISEDAPVNSLWFVIEG